MPGYLSISDDFVQTEFSEPMKNFSLFEQVSRSLLPVSGASGDVLVDELIKVLRRNSNQIETFLLQIPGLSSIQYISINQQTLLMEVGQFKK